METSRDKMETVFGKPIFEYSRGLALQEGELIDVSETAREAGIRYPVAITAALHADIGAIPEGHSYQSYAGRLWDVLWMMRMAATGVLPSAGDDSQRVYELIMHVGEAEAYFVKAVCGPGDEGEPVLTLLRPDES